MVLRAASGDPETAGSWASTRSRGQARLRRGRRPRREHGAAFAGHPLCFIPRRAWISRSWPSPSPSWAASAASGGLLAAGLTVGLVEGVTMATVGPRWRELGVTLVLLGALLVRARGLDPGRLARMSWLAGLGVATLAVALPALVAFDPYYLYVGAAACLWAALATAWGLLAYADRCRSARPRFSGPRLCQRAPRCRAPAYRPGSASSRQDSSEPWWRCPSASGPIACAEPISRSERSRTPRRSGPSR